MRAPEITTLLEALGASDADVRFVGGCVRDTVLGRPVADVDLATQDLPEAVIAKLEQAGLHAVPTGLSHGTVMAVVNHHGFEVTTLRKDTSSDGRYAVVEFTTDWLEDASRRDFTFNAMSLTPDGALFDPFNGEQDAKEGHVRFIGDPRDRIKEDYLRILRFFRFVAHYGKDQPRVDVLDACRDLRDGLDRLSVERIRDELTKLFSAPDPSVALEAMNQAGVLEKVLPEIGRDYDLKRLLDVETACGITVDRTAWLRRFAYLLYGLYGQRGPVPGVGERLRLSNKDAKTLTHIQSAAAAAEGVLEGESRNHFLHTYGEGNIRDAVVVAWARSPGRENPKWQDLFRKAEQWSPKTFPLSGADLKAVGIVQGPEMGRVLNRLTQDWIESGFSLTADDLRSRITG